MLGSFQPICFNCLIFFGLARLKQQIFSIYICFQMLMSCTLLVFPLEAVSRLATALIFLTQNINVTIIAPKHKGVNTAPTMMRSRMLQPAPTINIAKPVTSRTQRANNSGRWQLIFIMLIVVVFKNKIVHTSGKHTNPICTKFSTQLWSNYLNNKADIKQIVISDHLTPAQPDQLYYGITDFQKQNITSSQNDCLSLFIPTIVIFVQRCSQTNAKYQIIVT